MVSQAEYFEIEFGASGECDGVLAAGAGEGAGGGTNFAGYRKNWRNEAEGFVLFFLSRLDGSYGEHEEGSLP